MPTTLALRNPFKNVGKAMQHQVELRDYLTAGDFVDARKNGGADNQMVGYHLIAAVAGLVLEEVMRLDVRDVADIDDHIEKIRSRPKETAAEST